MKSGKQRYIKQILWGLFIALNVIPLFFPNESIMWTLRSIGYQVEGFRIHGISSIKIDRLVDDNKDRLLELKHLELGLSRDEMGLVIDVSIANLNFKDRHLPNYKLKNLLQSMSSINGLSMGPGLRISEFKIDNLRIEFSESSAPFEVNKLKIENIHGKEGYIVLDSLTADGPNIRYLDSKLEVLATPDQFADIESPVYVQTELKTNPLKIDPAPLDQLSQKL